MRKSWGMWYREKKKKKILLLTKLNEFDSLAERRQLSVADKLEREITANLEKAILMDEISWRHKSRELWLREGDKNTKFFHRLANSRRRNNSISSLIVDGEISTDSDAISNYITQFYTGLFTEKDVRRPLLDGLEFSAISHDDVVWLDRPFDEEEVLGVVQGLWGQISWTRWFSHGLFLDLLELPQIGHYGSVATFS
jgi:hypothetical protein